MNTPPLFSKKALAWLVGLGTVSFILVIGLSILLNDPRYMGTYGADSFSNSALGHKVFYRALKQNGFNVLQSQNRTSEKFTPNSLLLILEPGVGPERMEELSRMFGAKNVLLVLPKRNGIPDILNRRWVSSTSPVGEERIKQILDQISGEKFSDDPTAGLVPSGKDKTWKFTYPFPMPDIDEPQTIYWSRLIPVVYNSEGTLLGKLDIPGKNFFILSDPDILQNHGLGKGENANFVFEMISGIGLDFDVIIFDETSHGHVLSPSLLKSAFSPPFIFPVIIFLSAIATLIWATSGRFEPARTEHLNFRRDKLPLIQNISNLLMFGGHFGTVTERYYQEALKDVAEKLYAPPGLHGMDLIKWVDGNNEGRNISVKFEDIRRRAFHSIMRGEADSHRHVKLANDVFNWKNEVLYGTGKNKQTK